MGLEWEDEGLGGGGLKPELYLFANPSHDEEMNNGEFNGRIVFGQYLKGLNR